MGNEFMEHIHVGSYLELFRQTKNPLYALRALHNALRFGYPIPREVSNYTAAAINEIVRMAQDPPKPSQRPVAIAKALGLHKDGAGQGSAFTEFSTHLRNREIALATDNKVNDYGPGKEDYAYDEIVKECGWSKAKVRRNYKKHQAQWRTKAAKMIESGGITYEPTGDAKCFVMGSADDHREAAAILREAEGIRKK